MMDEEQYNRLKSATNRLLRLKTITLEEVDALPKGVPLQGYVLYLATSGKGGKLYYTGEVAEGFAILSGRRVSSKLQGKKAGTGSFVLDFNKETMNTYSLSVVRRGQESAEVILVLDHEYNYSWGILRE